MQRQDFFRSELKNVFGISDKRCFLDPEFRGKVEHYGIIAEKWIWTSEPGSKVTSVLYRPEKIIGKIPAVVLTNGHGESKNSLTALYTGQLYAKLGLACLIIDTIGEEERHIIGDMATRAHDDADADRRALRSGRIMLGKIIFDVIRAVDFVLTRDYVNKELIGVAGNSLGGMTACWVSVLDTRIKMSVVSGCGIGGDNYLSAGKACVRVSWTKMREICNWSEFMSLSFPHCAMLIMNGEKDIIINRNEGEIWRQTCFLADELSKRYEHIGQPGKVKVWFEPAGGHRSYHNHKDALLWINDHIGTPGLTREQIQALPTITLEEWCNRYGLDWDPKGRGLYWTPLNYCHDLYADLNISPISIEKLKCLKPNEVGKPEYTLEGWLDRIEGDMN